MYHRCPDCGVTMEAVDFGVSEDRNVSIGTGEKREGLPG